jgi:hypothetical protein
MLNNPKIGDYVIVVNDDPFNYPPLRKGQTGYITDISSVRCIRINDNNTWWHVSRFDLYYMIECCLCYEKFMPYNDYMCIKCRHDY